MNVTAIDGTMMSPFMSLEPLRRVRRFPARASSPAPPWIAGDRPGK